MHPSTPRGSERSRALLVLCIALAALLLVLAGPTLTGDAKAATNLLSENQRTLDADPTGWHPIGVARTWVDSQYVAQGTAALKVGAYATSFNGTRSMSVTTSTGTAGVPVQAGEVYQASFQSRPYEGFTTSVACELTWFRTDGSIAARASAPWVKQSPNAWKRFSCEGTAPSDAAYAAVRANFRSVHHRDLHWLDDASLLGSSGDTTTTAPSTTTTAPSTTSTTAATTTTTEVSSGTTVNLLDRHQQDFESQLSGWVTQGNAQIARTTDAGYQSSAALRVTGSTSDPIYTDGSRTVRAGTRPGTDGVPASPGTTYRGTIRVQAPESGSPVRCEIRFYDANGWILETALGAESPVTGSWTMRSCERIAPQGTAFAALRVHVADADYGDSYLFDDAWLVDGSSGGSADGSTATTAPPPTTTTTTGPPSTTTTTAPPPTVPDGTYPARGSVGYRGSLADLRVIDGPEDAPAGSSYSGGTLSVTANDFVLESVYVKGGIDFYGSGTLTVRNSVVEPGYGGWVTIVGRTSGSTMDVRDSTIRWRPGGTPDVGVGAGAIQIQANVRIIAIRNDISGTADGIQAAGDGTRIEQNWIHDLATVGTYPNNTHNDGVQVYDGENMVIANNRIEIGFNGTHQNAALFFQPGGGNSIGVQIVGNYLQGGGFTLRLEGPTVAWVRDNVFGPLEGGAWGDAYAWSPARTDEWTRNVRTDGSVVGDPEG